MTDSKDSKNSTKEMDRLMKRIAAFRGVLVADRTIAAILFATFILFTVNSYPNPIPLYICVFDLLVPLVVHELQKRNLADGKEADEGLPLPLLRKKYKYSELYSKAHSFNFILVTLFLFLWNQNMQNADPPYAPAKVIPLLIMIVYVVIRLFFWAYYLIMFKWFTMKIIK